MKRISFSILLVLSALLLASCSMHTGLGSTFNTAKTASTKKIKATHTPPAPSSSTAAAGTAAPSSETIISIKDTAFTPNVFQVKVGATVTWVNNDTVQHTVTSDTSLFDSGPIDPGGKFTYTFTQAGSFLYHCNIHKTMTASIIVQ